MDNASYPDRKIAGSSERIEIDSLAFIKTFEPGIFIKIPGFFCPRDLFYKEAWSALALRGAPCAAKIAFQRAEILLNCKLIFKLALKMHGWRP